MEEKNKFAELNCSENIKVRAICADDLIELLEKGMKKEERLV